MKLEIQSVKYTTERTTTKSIPAIFDTAKTKLGLPPSVVVYNASSGKLNDKADPLALPLEQFTRDFAINTTSAFMAAKHAALALAALPASAARTFIFTGNCTNVMPIGVLMDSGVGKSATAHIIQVAAEAYKDRGFNTSV
ncbi:glucose 1-dehydrogenase [Apiospora aurea]|uniref:Glucose 1-dehydrogenase n=1 Tax=Apiospora aurea TaxID=335848 RepID=A0ABR1QUK7_9PEZI